MVLLWFLCLLLVGCDKLDAALPALSLARRDGALPQVTTVVRAGGTVLSEAERRQMLSERQRLRQKWTLQDTNPQKAIGPCTPGVLPSGEPLTIAYVDARDQKKSLIPRRVAERLESAGLAEVTLGDDSQLSRDASDGATLPTLVATWNKRRYAIVFYVTQYSGPALILRIGELRRSWYPGQIAAQAVLYDTDEKRAICGYNLHVHNDTEDAPIRSRLQADTRMRLERDLASLLLDAARAEFARGLPSVTLPW